MLLTLCCIGSSFKGLDRIVAIVFFVCVMLRHVFLGRESCENATWNLVSLLTLGAFSFIRSESLDTSQAFARPRAAPPSAWFVCYAATALRGGSTNTRMWSRRGLFTSLLHPLRTSAWVYIPSQMHTRTRYCILLFHSAHHSNLPLYQ